MQEPRLTIDCEDVFAAFYEAVLRRPADDEGLAYWLGRIADVPAGARRPLLIDILQSFVTSAEGRRKLASALADDPALTSDIRDAAAGKARLRSEFLDPAVAGPRDIVGLGTHCYAASVLDLFGRRRWSGPFDWIFSRPAMVRDCLDDDFAELLDTHHYRRVPLEERTDPDLHRVRHVLFEARYGLPQPVFNHTDADTDAGHAYLVRCVERFRAALGSGEPIAFLQVTNASNTHEDDFAATIELLRRHTAAPRLVQVIVDEEARTTPVAHVVDARAPDARLLRFTGSSAWGATRFEDHLDDLMLMRAADAAFVDIGAAA